ncbi:MAG: LPS assembly protein LptD [Gammaproteobacteria bacterium]|nr:LPS assembly protein LptD [Gammaproteobacteria bacterium]
MDAIKRKTLTGIIISFISQPIIAADSEWECRVSADGASWDCYKDGNLVMQPMPEQAAPVIKPATVTPVPDTDKLFSETIAAEPEPVTTVGVVSSADTAEKEPVTKKATTTEIIDMRPQQEAVAIETPAAVREPVSQPETRQTSTTSAEPPKSAAEPQTKATVAETPKPESATLATSGYCFARRPQRIQRPVSSDTDKPTTVDADDAVMDENTGIANFSGDVVLIDNDQKLVSDQLKYNTNTEDVEASGNLSYQRPDMYFTGDSATMNLNSETGQVMAATYKIPSSNARGETGELHMMGNGVTVYKETSYTTCDEGNNDWVFNASEVRLDENTGVGTAEHMKLYFMDTPVLYLPWATFPIDDRRKSGFLTPSIGSSDSTGFDLSAPYYLNLAPNYDATITPRIMSKRGIQLGGEFRYLDSKNNLVFSGEALPDDEEYTGNDSRGAASLVHSISFNNQLRGALNLNYVSDDDYLEDLGGSLAVTSTRHLKREALLNYNGGWFSLKGQLLQYQTIDKTIAPADQPYKLLPRVSFNTSREIIEDIYLDVPVQYTNFDHSLTVDGSRFDLNPSLSYLWNRSWGFLKPKASLRYTTYELENRAPGLSSSVDRTTTTFSLDSGLIFERPASWFGKSTTQTLEPRAFYVYTPEENQDDIPLFDTGTYNFGVGSLFRENRFSGPDRVGDTNQLTLAVSSRFLAEQTAQQYLAVTLGQIFYFEDREIGNVSYYEDSTTQTSTTTALSNDTSSYVATLESRPFQYWTFDAGLQWDSDLIDDMEKSFARVRYLDNERHLFSARYQYDSANNEFTKLSAYWPVADNTTLVGHSYYSIDQDRSVESVLGIEHGSSCCWRFRALVRDYQANASDENNLSFMLQLELRGFTSFGDDVDAYLEETIEGFVREK